MVLRIAERTGIVENLNLLISKTASAYVRNLRTNYGNFYISFRHPAAQKEPERQSSGSFCPLFSLSRRKKRIPRITARDSARAPVGTRGCRRRPIFPEAHASSIVGAHKLNYRVRNGNGWTLVAINTDWHLSRGSYVGLRRLKDERETRLREMLQTRGSGDPRENRTPVCGVRGRRLSLLTIGPDWCAFRDSNPGPAD